MGGRWPYLQGTGKPLRQFIHAKDIARLCVWALFHYDKEDAVMLAPGDGGEVCRNSQGESHHCRVCE
jgi:nucleoside-diphosphate-sugar epimerase